MPNLSQGALQAVLASATDKVFLECITIMHSQINTVRIVNDSVDLTRSEGNYQRFPFRIRAATSSVDRPPSLEITADAVDQQIVFALRSLAGLREKATIRYEVVLADSPNQIEFGPVTFEFDSMRTDSATQVTVNASFLKGALNDAFPKGQFSPSNADG